MKKSNLLILALFLSGIMSSCDSDFGLSSDNRKPVNANIEKLTDEHILSWSVGDSISVFDFDKTNSLFVSEGASSAFNYVKTTKNAVVSDELPSMYAVYPYTNGASIQNDGNVCMIVPGFQKVEDATKPNKFFMGAANSDPELRDVEFKIANGYLKIPIKGNFNLTKVLVSGKNSETINGAADVLLLSDGTPKVTFKASSDESQKTMTLILKTPIKLDLSKATDIYVPLLPMNFNQGFSITFVDHAGSSYVKEYSAAEIIKKSITSLPDVSVISENGEEPFLSYSEIGFYGFDDVLPSIEYVFTKGEDQYQKSSVSNGKYSFTLLNARFDYYVRISDIPSELQVGSTYSLKMDTNTVSSDVLKNVTISAELIKKDDSKLWFTDKTSELGFIITY